MTKYFARFDRKTEGPFTLTQLVDAGVRPGTYVWCKGMDDWAKAQDVADICRAMRCRLAGLPIPGEESADIRTPEVQDGNSSGLQGVSQGKSDAYNDFGNIERQQRIFSRFGGFPEQPVEPDYNLKPMGISIFYAVLLTLFCFPITGAVAIWAAYKFNSLWNLSEQDDISGEERRSLRIRAYEKARVYRMMVGLSLSLGLLWVGLTFYSHS